MVLTKFFEYLRDNHSLLDQSTPEPKLAMFYIDKDVDDLFGKLLISNHIVYTPFYSIENHLFHEGELISSIATAGSLDIELVHARIPEPKVWRTRVATHWRDWLALCLLARKLSLPHPASYAMHGSRINVPADADADDRLLKSCLAEMHQRSGLTKAVFDKKLAASYRLLKTIFAQSRFDQVFKGKWYVIFALRELERESGGLFNRNGASDRLIGSLIATANFEGPWAEHFKQPLRSALALL
jgi:hypothetical protein